MGYWVGVGFNLVNWGFNGYDFFSYIYLRLVYWGMNSDYCFIFILCSDVGDGNVVIFGNSISIYFEVEILFFVFVVVMDFNLSSIIELVFSVSSDIFNGSSIFYFDDI